MINQNNLQKLNFQNLLLVSKLLKKVEHFVFYGTLLGLIREQKIIDGDDDVDFMVNLKNKKNVIRKMKLNKSFKINKKVSNEYFTQFIKKKNNLISFVDFYFYTKSQKNDYIIERHNWLANIYDQNFALHYSTKMVFPIKKDKKFKTISIPNNPVSLLKILYGKKWIFPLKKNIQYRVEIKNNKPFIIRRSFLGSITRWFKELLNKKFVKKI
jgi:phosphorylcholine metabolism protein LicD